jgi:hypothetical protein
MHLLTLSDIVSRAVLRFLNGVQDVVERQADGERMDMRLECQFDRLPAEKLARGYE